MAQYDVHEWRGGGNTRYVVDVQSDLLSHLATRVVVPLQPMSGSAKPADILNPVVDIDAKQYFLSTAELAGTDRRNLGEIVDSMADRSLEVTRAVDMILSGI